MVVVVSISVLVIPFVQVKSVGVVDHETSRVAIHSIVKVEDGLLKTSIVVLEPTRQNSTVIDHSPSVKVELENFDPNQNKDQKVVMIVKIDSEKR